MRLRCLSFIVLIVLCTTGFVAPGEKQNESPIKVVSAPRTKKYLSAGTPVTAKMPEKNVLLVLRIEGITLEEFEEAAEKNEIYLMAGENQYKLGSRATAKERRITIGSKERVISPLIILTFSVPKDILKMELVVSNHPHTVFEAEKEISDRLNDWEVR